VWITAPTSCLVGAVCVGKRLQKTAGLFLPLRQELRCSTHMLLGVQKRAGPVFPSDARS
jgi:hypothetical protein